MGDNPSPDFQSDEGLGNGPSAELPRYPSPGGDSLTPSGVPGPLGVFDTIGVSFGLYRADTVKLWRVMAMVIIPVQAVILILRVITIPHGAIFHDAKIYVPNGTGSGYVIVSTLGTLLSEVVLLISVGAAYRILLGRHLGHPADLGTSVRFALERLVPLLGVTVLVFVLTVIGLLCIVIPGIYLFVALVLAVPVLMAEDLRGWGATQRSRELVSGEWWHVFGAMIAAFIVAGIGIAIATVLVGPIVRTVSPHSVTGFFVVDAIVSSLISIVVSPFVIAVPVVLYVDMLVRKNDPHLPRLLA